MASGSQALHAEDALYRLHVVNPLLFPTELVGEHPFPQIEDALIDQPTESFPRHSIRLLRFVFGMGFGGSVGITDRGKVPLPAERLQPFEAGIFAIEIFDEKDRPQ